MKCIDATPCEKPNAHVISSKKKPSKRKFCNEKYLKNDNLFNPPRKLNCKNSIS